jgi:pilus assembly protein Flp/PilA
MFKHFIATLKDEKGQALAEYGLILALIAVIAIAALTLLGTNVAATLSNIAGQM